MNQPLPGRERRRFFRIRDEVSLEYKGVDKHTANNEDPNRLFPDASELHLFTEFRRLDAQADQTLHIISEQNRHVADYLRTLNHKLDLLAQTLVAEHQSSGEEKITRISLCEEGIAFESDKPLYRGSFIAMRLLFLPDYVGVVLFAQVIRCTLSNDKHLVAAKFHRLNDQQRQLLSKHIMQAQLLAKRRSQAQI